MTAQDRKVRQAATPKLAALSRFLFMRMMKNSLSTKLVLAGLVLLILAHGVSVAAQQPERDVSKESARSSRDWVRDGVVYEIFPRAFSAPGDFNGITARLDSLKDVGVD